MISCERLSTVTPSTMIPMSRPLRTCLEYLNLTAASTSCSDCSLLTWSRLETGKALRDLCQLTRSMLLGMKCGFSPDQIAWALDRGIKKGLVERSPRGRGLGTHEHLRVTSAGVYTARILI